MSENIPDINELVLDRNKFNSFIYTPVKEALEELKRRREDKQLIENITSILNNDIPKPLVTAPKAVIFRQVATPNHEIRRFMSIVELMELEPLFWEYYEDKFVSNNEVKYYLGMLLFYIGIGKNGGMKCEYEKIIDFNCSNGKKLSEVKTIWKESLVSFHHSLFKKTYRNISEEFFFDASDWLHRNGPKAIDYYKNYLYLFISHGILLENIMLDSKEIEFTKDIFLPAFIKVIQETGLKPLIIALEPTEIETDEFWMSHPYSSKKVVDDKINKANLSFLNKIKYLLGYKVKN